MFNPANTALATSTLSTLNSKVAAFNALNVNDQRGRDLIRADVFNLLDTPSIMKMLIEEHAAYRSTLRSSIISSLAPSFADSGRCAVAAEGTEAFRIEVGREASLSFRDMTAAQHAVTILTRALS